jgi:hypothetical protein
MEFFFIANADKMIYSIRVTTFLRVSNDVHGQNLEKQAEMMWELTENRDLFRHLVNTIMSFGFHKILGIASVVE